MLAGLGAGLATYAQTGGSGSKALLSGLTAGFGTNASKYWCSSNQQEQTAGTICSYTIAATQGLQHRCRTNSSITNS
jgi:hypothetical protein